MSENKQPLDLSLTAHGQKQAAKQTMDETIDGAGAAAACQQYYDRLGAKPKRRTFPLTTTGEKPNFSFYRSAKAQHRPLNHWPNNWTSSWQNRRSLPTIVESEADMTENLLKDCAAYFENLKLSEQQQQTKLDAKPLRTRDENMPAAYEKKARLRPKEKTD
ncbi:maker292 [Drosophila busckii]|uniref:Maker292 n=1 Tax=Drosophila busckii TaxID=30019 RepID=A0A0M4F8M6_DROBS|nr:uncharacterized protein LOC108606663 [Drosophila busckii]ALC48762.1 maker292 [Drosophila busckii]